MAAPQIQEARSFVNIDTLATVDGQTCFLVDTNAEIVLQPVEYYLCPANASVTSGSNPSVVWDNPNGYIVNYNTDRNGNYNPNSDML